MGVRSQRIAVSGLSRGYACAESGVGEAYGRFRIIRTVKSAAPNASARCGMLVVPSRTSRTSLQVMPGRWRSGGDVTSGGHIVPRGELTAPVTTHPCGLPGSGQHPVLVTPRAACPAAGRSDPVTAARSPLPECNAAATGLPPYQMAKSVFRFTTAGESRFPQWGTVFGPPHGIAPPAATSPTNLPAIAADGAGWEKTPGAL